MAPTIIRLIEDSGTQAEFRGGVNNPYALGQGIRLLEDLGLAPFFGTGYMFLGEVYAASGRQKEALEHLKKAEALFEKMGMDYRLGKTREVSTRIR